MDTFISRSNFYFRYILLAHVLLFRTVQKGKMLTIIDKYIIKKYLSTFFFTALIFSLVATTIDFSEKVERFITEPCTKKQIIFDYYLTFLPWINSLLWPLFSLIAVIFFTSRMAYNAEIISILGAGVSFRRMLRPFILAASLITLLLLVSNHFILPNGNKIRLNFEHKYIDKTSDRGRTDNVHLFIGADTKAYVKYFRKYDTVATDLRIEQFKNSELVSIIEANSAKWLGEPNRWRLTDYQIRTFTGLDESLLIAYGKDLDTTLRLRPDDFVRYNNQKEMMTSPELNRFISQEKDRGLEATKNYEIEIFRRTADPFSVLILTLIGVAVAARKVRGGMGFHLAIGIGLGAIFVFLSKFSTTFALNQSFSPIFGVWIPNILFFGIALVLLSKAQK